jgi:glutathione-regulated potassium-efflux system protein KefB
MTLARLDLTGSVRGLYEAAVLLGREALEAVGIAADDIEKIETEYRRRDSVRLEEQMATGDIAVGRETMFTHDRKLDLDNIE